MTPSSNAYKAGIFICALFLFNFTQVKSQVYQNVVGTPIEEGQYVFPGIVATDASGNVYVVDSYARSIIKYSAAGLPISTYGKTESLTVAAIACDNSGNIYVVNSTTREFLIFAPDGKVRRLSTKLSANDTSYPQAIAIDSNNNIWAVYTSNNLVVVFDNAGKIIWQFGSYGNASGEFNQPTGIALDASNNAYIADYQNHRVQKIALNNNKVLHITGSYGGVDGYFAYPTKVACSAGGEIIVVDQTRIQRFNNKGEFKKKIGSPGSQLGQISGPSQVAMDPSENIFVIDQGGQRLQKFDSKDQASIFGNPFSKAGQLKYPNGLKSDADGNLFVIDAYNHRVQKFDSKGVYQNKWGSFGTGDGQFSYPSDIAVAADGSVYVTDTQNHRVQKFTKAGVYVTQFGGYGQAEGQLILPGAIAVDASGNVYVGDNSNRIHKFTAAGKFTSRWGGTGSANATFSGIGGMAFGTDGFLYVTDVGNSRVQRFTAAGDFKLTWGTYGIAPGKLANPQRIAIDASGSVYVTDSQHRVQRFSDSGLFQVSFGIFGAGPGQFNKPMGIAVAKAGTIYVADYNNFRLQVFDPFVIDDITPKEGESGTPIVIKGKGFGPSATGLEVKFGDVIATPTSVGETFIEVKVPPMTKTGQITVTRSSISVQSRQEFVITPLQITKVTPLAALPGTEVTIEGRSFGNGKDQVSVSFSGIVADIISAESKKIVCKVPDDATTGPLTVTREGTLATNQNEFLVLPLEITEFYPQATSSGKPMTIYGRGFSLIPGNNIVKFGKITAEVNPGPTNTSISIVVPEGAEKGKISVTVSGVTAYSEQEFLYSDLIYKEPLAPDVFVTNADNFAITLPVDDERELLELKAVVTKICDLNETETEVGVAMTRSPTAINVSIDKSVFDDPIGIKWHLLLTDKKSNVLFTKERTAYLEYPANSKAQNFPELVYGHTVKDYQIIAVPLKLKSAGSELVFKDLGEKGKRWWRVFSYDPASQETSGNPTAIEPGRGYWLITRAEDVTEISPGGGTVPPVTIESPAVIKMFHGWNLIGNPYNFDISWDEVIRYNGNDSIGKLNQYARGFEFDAHLKRYKGGFVFYNGNTEADIRIPISSRATGRTKQEVPHPLDSKNWTVTMTADDGNLRNGTLGIGMHPNAREALDKWDERSVPMFEGMSDYTFTFGEQHNLALEAVGTSDHHSWTAEVNNSAPLKLSWDNSYFGVNSKRLVIDDSETLDLIDMRKSNSMVILPGKHTLKFHFGDEEYVAGEVLREGPQIGGVAPNPLARSAGQLRVMVNLPSDDYSVSFRLYDVLGKGIVKDGPGSFDAGRYLLEWNTDFSSVRPGVYLLRIDLQGSEGPTTRYRKIVVE